MSRTLAAVGALVAYALSYAINGVTADAGRSAVRHWGKVGAYGLWVASIAIVIVAVFQLSRASRARRIIFAASLGVATLILEMGVWFMLFALIVRRHGL